VELRFHAVVLACVFPADAVGVVVPVVAAGVVPTFLNVAGLVRWKLEFDPEPQQPVNEPATRTIPAHAPTVRVVMPVPFSRARAAVRPPGMGSVPPGAAAAAGSSLSAAGV
jgi:hypothetical protein